MGLSIQDYAKKINSSISLLDCVSLLVTVFFLIGFSLYLYAQRETTQIPVSYVVSNTTEEQSEQARESQPFGSSKGKTYTFSWCQGATAILDKNKIYFETEADAKNSGRTLSKLCQK